MVIHCYLLIKFLLNSRKLMINIDIMIKGRIHGKSWVFTTRNEKHFEINIL